LAVYYHFVAAVNLNCYSFKSGTWDVIERACTEICLSPFWYMTPSCL